MKKNNVLLGMLLVAVAVGLVVLSLNSKEETETMSENAAINAITVYVAPARYTYEFMEKTKYFTVMTFDQKHKQVLRYMGSHSGRDEDKGKALGLTTLYTENGTPYYAEAQEVYECEMIYHSPLDSKGFGEMPTKFYANFSAGVHHMYMGKVIRVLKK